MNGTIRTITDGQDGGSSGRAGTVQDSSEGRTLREFDPQDIPTNIVVGSQVSYNIDSNGNAIDIRGFGTP